jgi:large subunit ribosomal protein L33
MARGVAPASIDLRPVPLLFSVNGRGRQGHRFLRSRIPGGCSARWAGEGIYPAVYLVKRPWPHRGVARYNAGSHKLNRRPRGRPFVLFVRVESSRMAKNKKKVETVFLVCEETGDYNYTIRRKPGGEKLKLSKYSPRLRKHTVHVEKKK